jgi:hypothetical protein
MMLQLQPDPDCPYVFGLQRALLTNEPTLVPGKMPLCQRLVLVMHDRLLGSDHAHPAPVRSTGGAFYRNGKSASDSRPSPLRT